MSAFLFAAGHGVLFNSLYTFVAGVFWGVLTVRYNSILPSVFCHMVNNAAVVFLRTLGQGTPDAGPLSLRSALQLSREFARGQSGVLLTALAVLLFAVCILWLLGRRLRRQSEPEIDFPMNIYEAVRILFHWPILLVGGAFLITTAGWLEKWISFFFRLLR